MARKLWLIVMKILVTNDDGIFSPGIAALAKIARNFGEVQVVAPEVGQSSQGQAITTSSPLNYKKSPVPFDGIPAFEVDGTPADCVALGTHISPNQQIVLSGINMGSNLGNSIWHSGTLAAAKQAVLLGLKGIALSTPVKPEPDFNALEEKVKEVLELLLYYPDPFLFNVNIPAESKGIKWTRQSVRFYDGKIVPSVDPMGRKHYWYTVVPLEPAEKGTDRWAVENNFISITPLRLDLTDEERLEKMKKKLPVS
jgi:5'-nucleotidase